MGKREADPGKHAKPEGKKVSTLRRIFRLIGALFLMLLFFAAGLVAYLTASEYKPADEEILKAEGGAAESIKRGDSLTVLSWNIGYGALGDNADFFMDGGRGVLTADEERLKSNLSGVIEEIAGHNPDIFLLQEIDESAKRSHYVDETDMFRRRFRDYSSSFAYNYKVNYVPYPLPTLGKVYSGIMTFSAFPFSDCRRLQLPLSFSWPVRTANLKRSLLVSRIPVSGSGNELVLINLHLEAYDSGEGKIAQTKMLAEILNEEYKKGNYVIAGGDFNQIFSSEDKNAYPLMDGTWHPGVIDITGITGTWSFLMDETVPSCRSLDRPYEGADHAGFQYYLIDGFIVSGNIKTEEFSNQDLDFEFSDHNPVLLKAVLR